MKRDIAIAFACLSACASNPPTSLTASNEAPSASQPAAPPLPGPAPSASIAPLPEAALSASAVPSAPQQDVPSFALLSGISKELEKLRPFLDAETGVASIEVGPEYNPETQKSSDIKLAKKLCGPKAEAEIALSLRIALMNVRTSADLRCDERSCVQRAEGEWANEATIVFRRKGERLILSAIVIVKDVPMRVGADKDRAWAKGQLDTMSARRCPRRQALNL
jgi:hypothetical protein